MAKKPTTIMLKKNALAAKKRADVPAPVDGIPIGDGDEKWEAPAVAALPTGDSGEEYTRSILRDLLPDRGRAIRSNEHYPTVRKRQAVINGYGLGMTQEELANLMGITPETLRRHYRDELDVGRHLLMADIKENMYNIARNPKHKNAVQAGMFLLGKLGGDVFKEKKSVELSGPDGKPLQIDQRTQTIDPTLLSPEQRDALREIVSSAMKLAQQPAPVQLEGEYKDVTDE